MDNNVEQKGSNLSGEGIVLPPSEAEEYCLFKRQKRIAEVAAAFSRSEIDAAGGGLTSSDIKRLAESAKRLGSSAVRVTPNFVGQVKGFLSGSAVLIDCLIGGTGETTAKVKGYEAKQAVLGGAKELTLVICSSALKNGKQGEVKKEIKKVVKAAGKGIFKRTQGTVKVVSGTDLSYEDILRLGRIAAECGAKYVSVPYFTGVDALKRDLKDCCMMEVTGVETAADYKLLVGAGIERIGVAHAESIYSELMREAQDCAFTVPVSAPLVAGESGTATPLSDEKKENAGEKYSGFSGLALAAAPFGTARRVAERTKEKKDGAEGLKTAKAEQTSLLDSIDRFGNTEK